MKVFSEFRETKQLTGCKLTQMGCSDLLGSKSFSVALQEVARDNRSDNSQAFPRLQLAGECQQARRLDVGVLVQF